MRITMSFLICAMFLSLFLAASDSTGGYPSEVLREPLAENRRFTDNGDGTVTDNRTGLMWLRDADLACTAGHDPDGAGKGKMCWENAFDFVGKLNRGDFGSDASGNCGHGDWRLPDARELGSLICFEHSGPALSDDAGTGQWSEDDRHGPSAFSNVRSECYWSCTSSPDIGNIAKVVYLHNGNIRNGFKSCGRHHVWPVRGGEGSLK